MLVAVSSAETGIPVFLLHGTPGSRSGPRPRSDKLYMLGIRLISYDRPGYGGSSRHPGRSVADAADDVRAIADALGLDRFAVVGRSGGAPHALACAARMPDRVTRTAALVGLAPANAEGLDWYDGMTDGNVQEYTTAEADLVALTEQLHERARRTADDPDWFLDFLRDQMTEADKRVVRGLPIRRQLLHSYREALRCGPYGWVDDVLAFGKDWGFDFADITGPVLLWHGAEDNFSPAGHTRWLARQIPHAEVRVQLRTAHFGALEVLPEILSWLASGPVHSGDGPRRSAGDRRP
ncbi:alpha/beta fold hydrolase [Dactylosporangium sp. CA-092794]|uniref:alpha/beta fold hydrolase n=1 Tax=Dactylosporangium sp. CA-092794 TaxID=3239929 RepID=UPI003D8FCD2D